MLTLGIETSCDETSCAVVKDGRKIMSNIISSQIDIHKKFGGVVPEIASRKHIETINNIIDQALSEAKVDFADIDIVGVTYGPGLVGALLVGLSSAKAIAYSLNKPLVGVNHIEGHICANYLVHEDLKPPFTGLVVSGGHTYLINSKGYNNYELVGRTRDDAAGEAFDKVARSLGLGYPGGPEIDKLSKIGDPYKIAFPRVTLEKNSYDFSFSGLKTAVLNYLNSERQKGREVIKEDVAASFQQAVLDVLVEKVIRLELKNKTGKIAISGGVAANSQLREMLDKKGRELGIKVYYPPLELCTDNAAMIASSAYYNYINGKESKLSLGVVPNLSL